MPKATPQRGTVDQRPYAWWANDPDFRWHFPDEAIPISSDIIYPHHVGWSQFTDQGLQVAGFSAAARKRIIRQAVQLVEDELRGGQRARLEEADALWGTHCAAVLLRRLTQGGKRTWRHSRRGKPGLLALISDLERPDFLAERSIPDCIWLAQRRAFTALRDFTVDVPAKNVKALQDKAGLTGSYRTTRGGRFISKVELHNRVIQVLRFYGVAEPVMGKGGRRLWRLWPWRLAFIDHQFSGYRNVRLDGLDWLSPDHFIPYLNANQPRKPGA